MSKSQETKTEIRKELVSFLGSRLNKDRLNFGDGNNYFGYANGYVAIPPEHPFYGKHYIEVFDYIDVHGGLTFSGPSNTCLRWNDTEVIDNKTSSIPTDWWVFGFDTMHGNDYLKDWPRERCIEETLRMKKQLEEI